MSGGMRWYGWRYGRWHGWQADGWAVAMGGPNPKRDLTTLVRKLNLLTGKIQIT